MNRRVIFWASVLIVVVSFAAYIAFSPCDIVRPMFDSSTTKTAEVAEFSDALHAAYDRAVHEQADYPKGLGKLPRPLKVDWVFGRWASVSVDGPMPRGLVEGPYGGAWEGVFAHHHASSGPACVYIRYSWKGGGASTACCRAQWL